MARTLNLALLLGHPTLSSYNHLTIIGTVRLSDTRTEDGYAQGNGLHGSNQPIL